MMACRVVVYHAYYGCDTGCCGHRIEVGDDESHKFAFDHCDDDEDPFEFAKRLVTEEYGVAHVADLDWANSEIWDYNDNRVVKHVNP